jgi:hypothetical protein
MKLARTTFFVITNDCRRAGRIYRQPSRPNLARTVNIRRTSTHLTARWHVCPQTRRLECAWSLETAPSEGQCRYAVQRWRSGRHVAFYRAAGGDTAPAETNQPASCDG